MGAAWWGQEEREGAEGRGREVSAATDLPYVASPMRNTFPLALVAGMVAASSANAQLPRYGLSTRVELHLLPAVTSGPLDPTWHLFVGWDKSLEELCSRLCVRTPAFESSATNVCSGKTKQPRGS